MGELNEDLTIGSQPNALVLFNPALLLAAAPGYPQWDASREESLRLRMGTAPKNLSPWHFVQSATPPTLVFHGQADTTIPFWTAQAFQQAQLNHGGRSRLVAFPNAKHGFFNFGRSNNAALRKTLEETDRFLQSLGYLEGPQRVEDYLARVAPSK